MMLDLRSKNTAAQHPICRMRIDDLYHDHRMYPITEVKHLHCQRLPMIVQAPMTNHQLFIIA